MFTKTGSEFEAAEKMQKCSLKKHRVKTLNIMYRGNLIMARGCLKTSVVDPDLVGSASFCRIGIGIQGMPIRIGISSEHMFFFTFFQ
jgi:hypothetical protein